MTPTNHGLTADALADLRERAAKAREFFKDKPAPDQFLTAEERANAAPFYFEMRVCVKQLKDAREAAGLTVAQVATKTGLDAAHLADLEAGMVTNPAWRTLGLYAVAVGRKLTLAAEG